MVRLCAELIAGARGRVAALHDASPTVLPITGDPTLLTKKEASSMPSMLVTKSAS